MDAFIVSACNKKYISAQLMFYGGFFCCDIYWYPDTYQNQVTCTISLLLRTEISVNSEHLPFCHWDCCQKQSFSCLPSLGHRICLLCKSNGLLNSLNSLHFCHCCISNGRTEILALTRATWMWMGSTTTGKEFFPRAFQKGKGYRWAGLFLLDSKLC